MAQATGSPASRKSTNWTPLTTRPSLTSRQGMTRTLSIGASRSPDHRERLGGIEPAVIERPSGDGAGEPRAIGGEQSFDIFDRGDAARGDDRDRHRFGQRQRRLDVEAFQRAVARNVGIDEGGDAGVLETAA